MGLGVHYFQTNPNVVNGDYGDGNHSSLDHGNGRFAKKPFVRVQHLGWESTRSVRYQHWIKMKDKPYISKDYIIWRVPKI